MEWHPASFFRTDVVPENPFAILILNQPINENAFDAVRRHACYTLLADGGANRYYELMKARSVENIDMPSCILGDLDSIHPHVRAHYEKHHVSVLYDPDQYSTDFTKCIRFLQAHAHAIVSQENPAIQDNHDLYMTHHHQTSRHVQSGSSATIAGGTDVAQSANITREKSQQLDILVLGGLGGRVDQGFSQVHHLYAVYEEKIKQQKQNQHSSASEGNTADGDIYFLSEESLSFILPPGKNIIYTPFAYHQDQTGREDESSSANKKTSEIFSENVGLIPLSGPTLITLRGFEWDVVNWRTEIGGQLSTSNHIRADRLEVDVDVDTDRAILFTVELGARYKKPGTS